MSELQRPADTWNGTFDATAIVSILCCGIALYNVLELTLLIFITFKRWRGLYFWSMSISCAAILLYNVGLLCQYFRLANQNVGRSLDGIGWIGMVTGQALVLYSRLGLILHNDNVLRAVKWMIITNAVILHPLTEVMNFGSHNGGAQKQFARGYVYVEKIQMTIFCVQEFIISGLYVWQTLKLLKVVQKDGIRRTMWELFVVNLVIVIMDIGLLTIEYLDYRVLEQTVKGLVYSVKSKLELIVLGKLVDIVQSTQRSLSSAFGGGECYADNSRTGSGLERFDTGDPRPRWMKEIDKPSAEHIEHAPRDTYRSHQEDAKDSTREVQEVVESRPTAFLRHQKDCDTDLLYADAMRSISS